MGAFEQQIPPEIRARALQVGSELLFSYSDALTMVDAACATCIAILGIEAFEVHPNGVKPLKFSSYDVPFSDDWMRFVLLNGEQARNFIRSYPLGEDHGYLLTAASNFEYEDARDQT